MTQHLVDVAIPVPIDHLFTYIASPEVFSRLKKGTRVLVPFGRKALTGVAVEFPESSGVKGLKPIRDVLDVEPTFSPELLNLTRWIADYYLASWGDVLKAAAPHGASVRTNVVVRFTASDIDECLRQIGKQAGSQRKILEALRGGKSPTVMQLRKKTGVRNAQAAVHQLAERGWVAVEEVVERPKASTKFESVINIPSIHSPGDVGTANHLSDKQNAILELLHQSLSPGHTSISALEFLKKAGTSMSVLKTLERRGALAISRQEVLRQPAMAGGENPGRFELSDEQHGALDAIDRAVAGGTYTTFLLHGITGSGKTQVYIEAIRKVLAAGKTAVVLVPEISLTPQTVGRFKAHFGSDVAVMHSQLSSGERYDAWRQAHTGKVRIVVGPRSAVFAPLRNLGLVVVDEEHEASYKQFDASPRYNARDVAVVRALQSNAVVILGSATPSVESYHNALSGRYRLLKLTRRVDNAQLPAVSVVNMAGEKKRIYDETKANVEAAGTEFPKRLPQSSVSKILRDHIAERLNKKEGVILLQNRRGFSHVVECFECGHVERCDNCDVPLTFHASKKNLRCHYCGAVKKPPSACPDCQGNDLRYYAFGTQQVQGELEGLFSDAKIVRMDRDTTNRKGAHARILEQFGDGRADILLGTQIVAKGLDFPRVTLVGVVSADTQMLLPDFRASESTFQLLTQVAGRAGRSALAGEVLVQTLQPRHYSLKHVVRHDYEGFYKEEIEYRRALDYPPFSRIILVEFSGALESEVGQESARFAGLLTSGAKTGSFILLGPADAAIPRLRNRYRKHLILKGLKSKDPSGTLLHRAVSEARSEFESSRRNRKVEMIIDVDPQGMM